jgi:hypothetical protein
MNEALKEFWTTNLYFYLLNHKQLETGLASKITGMFLESDEILEEFSKSNFSLIDKKIIEAIDVILEFDLKGSVEDRIHYYQLKTLALKYKLSLES